jgi:hypothetical protein
LLSHVRTIAIHLPYLATAEDILDFLPYPRNSVGFLALPRMLETAEDSSGFPLILATAEDSLGFTLYNSNSRR